MTTTKLETRYVVEQATREYCAVINTKDVLA